MEEWKPIKGYEGVYEVSNLGKVRSLDRYVSFKINGIIVVRFCSGKELRPLKTGKDPVVNLCKDGLFTSMKLSRLVAEAFVANPNKYSFINHKDSDKTNNSANNLVWVPYHIRSNISNNVKEEWRNIPGYENIYEVSNTGKVRSITRRVLRRRSRNAISFEDCPEYESRELKPCRINKKSGIAVYHLHERYKAGRHGQTDAYYKVEDLIQLAFPELYKKEN